MLATKFLLSSLILISLSCVVYLWHSQFNGVIHSFGFLANQFAVLTSHLRGNGKINGIYLIFLL